MKKLLLGLAIAVFSVCFTGCEYDDDDLWSEVHDLGSKVEALEKASTDYNKNIAALQTIVKGLQKQVSVTSVTKTTDGYDIVFSNGEKASIADGKDGISAPAISVKKDAADNQYYWTLDGEWLLVEGNKVRASASTPEVRINTTSKEWEITNDGTNWTSTGIVAEGKDGDAFFKSVSVENGVAIFTLANGTSFRMPMMTDFAINGKLLSSSGATVLSYTAEKMSFVALESVPAGVSAVLNEADKTISVTITDPAAFQLGSKLVIKGADENGYMKIAAVTLYTKDATPEFLVINEGWYGHEGASVNIYYNDNIWGLRAYATANPGKELGTTGTVAVQEGDRLYFIAKDGQNITEVETNTMKHLSDIKFGKGNQASNMATIDATKGYAATSEGVYELALNPLVLGEKIFEGNAGDICNADGKIYFISAGKVYFYDPSTKAAPTVIGDANTGFARAGEYLYASSSSTFLKIKLSDNSTSKIELGCNILMNTWAYTPTAMSVSPDAKYIYFASAKPFSNGGSIKKFDVTSETVTDFWEMPADKMFYGSCVAVNPKDGKVYAISIKNYETFDIFVINKEDGSTIKTLKYTPVESTYWFPSQIFFIK